MIHIYVNSDDHNRKILQKQLLSQDTWKQVTQQNFQCEGKKNIQGIIVFLAATQVHSNCKSQALHMLLFSFKYPMFKYCVMHHTVEVGQWMGHSLPLQ